MRILRFILLLTAVVLPAVSAAAEDIVVKLTDKEIEQFLTTAKIVRTRELGKGVTNSLRATLTDGKLTHDAHVQTIDQSMTRFEGNRGIELNFRDSYKFNIAAYRLDRLLGLNLTPVSVERRVGGKSAAVTWWVDDVMFDEQERKKRKAEPPSDLYNRQRCIMLVFDQLIFNTDRNMGNILTTKDWKLVMIDHTRAFRIREDLENPKALARCDRVFLDRLKKLDQRTLEKELLPYLRNVEIRAMLKRRDRIVQNIEDAMKQLGEEKVLFDYLPAEAGAAR
jgi:hypothetical protein